MIATSILKVGPLTFTSENFQWYLLGFLIIIALLIFKLIKRSRRKAEERRNNPSHYQVQAPPGFQEEKDEDEFMTVEEMKGYMEIGRHVAYFDARLSELDVEEVDRLIEAGFTPITLDAKNDHYWFWLPGEKPTPKE
jgi:hypothetical protein